MTQPEDALLSAELGATHIGLNFFEPSPRFINAERARHISGQLHALQVTPVLVGVFVNASSDAIRSTLDEHNLDLAQLSGDNEERTLLELGDRAYKVYRLGKPHIEQDKSKIILLDAQIKGEYGGTGQKCDWDAAANIALQYDVLLAGGLTPDNVAQAIRRVQPWGVDVASGVESSPGVKNRAKLQRFINNARCARPGA